MAERLSLAEQLHSKRCEIEGLKWQRGQQYHLSRRWAEIDVEIKALEAKVASLEEGASRQRKGSPKTTP